MAIVKCKECGGELSTKADACPKCGAKRKQPSGCLKIILFLVLALIMLGFVASFFGDKDSLDHRNDPSPTARGGSSQKGYALTPIESTVLDNVFKEEMSVFLDGGDTILFDSLVAAPAIDVAREYDKNQVSADEKYYEKSLLVTGRILAINSGLGNEPYVVLKGINAFSSPQVHFGQPDVQRIASLSKGESSSFVCDGAGSIVGTPLFRKCKFADDYAVGRVKSAKSDAIKLLHGKRISGEAIPMLTIGAIAIARELPETSACLSNSEGCVSEIESGFKNGDADQKIAAVANELKLLGIYVPSSISK